MAFQHICLIIPAYNPGDTLQTLVSDLNTHGFMQILIVNDGTTNEADLEQFRVLEKVPGITLLHHSHNQGKGAALKTGYKYVLENFKASAIGLISLDSDGQHTVRDVINIAKYFQTHNNPNELILGVRSFDKNTPTANRLGNIIAGKLFYLRYSRKLEDTQTGLRGIPLTLIESFLTIPNNRYDFESACLIRAVENNYSFKEIPIQTVYNRKGPKTHFKPLIDSLRICSVLIHPPKQ